MPNTCAICHMRQVVIHCQTLKHVRPRYFLNNQIYVNNVDAMGTRGIWQCLGRGFRKLVLVSNKIYHEWGARFIQSSYGWVGC